MFLLYNELSYYGTSAINSISDILSDQCNVAM